MENLRPAPLLRTRHLFLPAALFLTAYACQKEDTPVPSRPEVQTISGTAAAKQEDGLSSTCVGCYVSGAELAVDNSEATNSFLYVVPGDSAFVQQKFEFEKGGKQGDTIRLLFSVPEGTADRTLFSNVELSAGNATTLGQDKRLASGDKVTLEPANGNMLAATWVASQAFNQVRVRLLGEEKGLQGLNIHAVLRSGK